MALSKLEVGNDVPFNEKWSVFSHIGDSLYIMVRHSHNVVSYAPLYIHRFQFLQLHFLYDSEKFNTVYTEPSKLVTVADKLKYYRYKRGLLQREVSDYIGIERSTYVDYEDSYRDYYPLDMLKRIADLLCVDISDIFDEYNSFLYYGQAEQIKALRKQMELTQKAFAVKYGVDVSNVKRWEQGKIRISKKMWERIFKG